MISPYIQKVGIRNKTDAASAEYFGRRILAPSVELIDSSHISSFNELEGTKQFIGWLNEHLPSTISGIHSPYDAWKLSTFISYVADARDIGVIKASDKNGVVLLLPGKTSNMMQAANFTLAAFSGDCDDWARLYAAVIYLLVTTQAQVYSVYFTPTHGDGHVSNLFSLDGKTWHNLDFTEERVWEGNPFEIANLFFHKYLQGANVGFSVAIARNIFLVPSMQNQKEKTYTPVLACADAQWLYENKMFNPSASIKVIEHQNSQEYVNFQQAAAKLFHIHLPPPNGGGYNLLGGNTKTALEIAAGVIAIGYLMNK